MSQLPHQENCRLQLQPAASLQKPARQSALLPALPSILGSVRSAMFLSKQALQKFGNKDCSLAALTCLQSWHVGGVEGAGSGGESGSRAGAASAAASPAQGEVIPKHTTCSKRMPTQTRPKTRPERDPISPPWHHLPSLFQILQEITNQTPASSVVTVAAVVEVSVVEGARKAGLPSMTRANIALKSNSVAPEGAVTFHAPIVLQQGSL